MHHICINYLCKGGLWGKLKKEKVESLFESPNLLLWALFCFVWSATHPTASDLDLIFKKNLSIHVLLCDK